MIRALAVLLTLLAGSSASAGAGELQRFVPGSWAALRQGHAGRPTVVHFWGLTCGPCLVELPEWGALASARPGASFITVAADPYPAKPAILQATLAKDGLAGAENYVFDGFSERLRFEVDPSWQGELPYTLLIAADGTVTTIDGAADLQQVRTWLDAQPRT